MVWECTTLLLGAYLPSELASNPLFSVVDGVVLLGERRRRVPPERLLRVVKMRGTAHSRDAHRFTIAKGGVAILERRRERRGA
jgi:circadian clock protein KaiC